jgi:putative nucleotidyltransferase with HDIG domain
MSLTSWAEPSAARLLSPLGNRWHHVRQVAEQARRVAKAVPTADRDLLVAAAYLHDVGYAPVLAITGFHPLDGARWVRDHGRDGRLARLVAHHSCAIYEAQVRGFLDALLAEFEAEESATYDALVFCDMTTGPTGKTVSFEERISDIHERYRPDHAVSIALALSRPSLAACHDRTLARLAQGANQPIYGSVRRSR